MSQDEAACEVLLRKLEGLSAEVERLAQRVAAVERACVAAAQREAVSAPPAATAAPVEQNPADQAASGYSEILARLALACFLLVLALVLRTLAASEVIPLRAGMWTGLGYSTLVLTAGWGLQRRGSANAGIWVLIGSVLLGAVVFEAAQRQQTLQVESAHWLLLAAGCASVWGARSAYHVLVPAVTSVVLLGVGGALTAAAGEAHRLALLVLVLNLAARQLSVPRAWALRVLVWVALLTVWGGWVLDAAQAPPSPPWFVPLLLLSFAYFALSAVWEVAGGAVGGQALDAGLLPLNLVALHLLLQWAGWPPGGVDVALGGGELALAGGLLAVAGWCTGRNGAAECGGGLVLAAGVGLFLGWWSIVGQAVLAAPAWALAGWGLAALARRWQNGGTRAISYLLASVGAVVALGAVVWVGTGVAAWGGGALSLAAVASGLHYRWLCRYPAPAGAVFFLRVDRGDSLRVLVLLAAVGFGLPALVVLLATPLRHLFADPAAAAACIWTVGLNLIALALLGLGQRWAVAEVRGVGLLLLVLGGGKVFLYDLVASGGGVLLAGVLSFGGAAGGGAVLLRRQGRHPGAADGSTR